MKQSEMKKLIFAGLIDVIILHSDSIDNWFVMASGVDNHQDIVEQYGNLLMTERGQKKTYTSLDRAYKALRVLGWDGPLTIMP
jgi:hypothetical protein